jgi:hypothetical protein
MNVVVISPYRNTSNNSSFVIEVREMELPGCGCNGRGLIPWTGSSEIICPDCHGTGKRGMLLEVFHDVMEWELIKRRNKLCEEWSEKVNTVVANPLPELKQ